MPVAEARRSSALQPTEVATHDHLPEAQASDRTAASMRSSRVRFNHAASKRLNVLVTDSPDRRVLRNGRRPVPLDWDGKSYTQRIAVVLQELFLLEAILPSPAESAQASDTERTVGKRDREFGSDYVVAFSAAARILGYDNQVSRDIALDAMLVFRKEYLENNRYDPTKAKSSTLIFKIAANMAWNVQRKLQLEKELRVYLDLSAVPDREHKCALAQPSEQFNQKVMKAWREALGNLTKPQQQLMTLYVTSGCSPAKVAEVLKVKPGTVRVRIHRARLRLRESRPLQKLAAELLLPVRGEF